MMQIHGMIALSLRNHQNFDVYSLDLLTFDR